ncbi:protein sprouty [Episyrphus balteatus]|uniref:protein sprouty n=1 Tax=Episyrphus balteatus TaxID=286459 RepID=UPI002485283E|nr:protein sprouty [Episyrphus balteatus]XP_055846560.1 protein sprouty [Episyrphus balteatus]XP_055846561.1 protein sprouty [Episyrphus balteatus]
MDRRNGGDPLAPPRPPKLLPRVHRPRAAEPPMMSAPPTTVQHQHQQQQQQQQQLCTNNHSSSRINSSSSNSNNNNTNNSSSNSRLNNTIASSRNSNNNSSSNTAHLTTPLLQLHHHQQQQQEQQHPHTTVSLNRNNSNLSSASSTSSVSTTVSSVNSFTRRRPPPPPLAAVTSSAPPSSSSPILPLLGASLNLNLLNNNININSIEPVPVSPVTLAAPRPESERLTNEYVDTPFRTAQQLQQASRNQHPAGQHIHGQTTTQHNLLLLQQSQRQQQQHNQQQQQQHHSSHHQSSGSHSNVVGTCVVSAATAASIHSNSRSLKGDATGGTGTTPGFGATHATSTAPASATLATSPTITRLQQQQHHRPNALPITQPITKQPASTTTFKKDLSASIFHEEPLDLHHIGSGNASSGGIGSGSMGSPIGGIILGDGAINPITCPRCERCRCEQCQSPRQLPQTWVCNKTCLCSAETIIDYASCLCCVKALFYHCARDQDMECDDGDSTLCVDDPCSCLPNKRAQRWGWLGALSLVLPCLWCYWPMRGCVAICEKCYARHAGHGCRCQAIGSTSSMLPIVNIGRSGSTGTNATIGGTKSSGISGGVHSGISGSGNGHHHHHHHHHHGGGGGGGGGGNTGGSDISAARILRKCDITPEKRLLDSSPEY